MKNLSDEGKVLTIFSIIMLWCAITSLSGHSELWIIPMLTLAGMFCLHLVISLIRDIYFARRRERLYERRYWEKYKADQEEP
ncbi:MAG: hypothetical protein J5994_10325 [Ruminococcus sp.]|nr:hypothetical protein [Ruminococcus sp.]